LSWVLVAGIGVACALTVLFVAGLAQAAAKGDEQLAPAAAGTGPIVDRRSGVADRRRSRRPWSNSAEGRRQADAALAAVRTAQRDVDAAEAALEHAIAVRSDAVVRAASQGVDPARIAQTTRLPREEVDFLAHRRARSA
jgi:hypothetical protein